MNQTIRVVSLGDLVKLELSSLCFVIGVFDTLLNVPVEDSLAPGNWIDLLAVMSDGSRISSSALHLLLLHGANCSSVSVSLTVHIPVGACVECAAHEGVMSDEAAHR